MKSTPQALPGLADLFSEIISKKTRSKGRPQKYTSTRHRAYEKKLLGTQKRCPRSVQNYHNARRAWEAIQKLENSEPILAYFQKRHTILSALGRIEEKKVIVQAACVIACYQLRGAKAYAEIRKFRYGDRWPDTIRLLHKIRKAVSEYRNLYPHQSCDEFKRDVELTFENFKKHELKYYQEEK
ncbi:MAG: hypothetical protein ACLP2Y_15730 [Limisphaerales bacterium]